MGKKVRSQAVNFGFAQYLDHSYWDWSEYEKEHYMVNAEEMLRNVCRRLYEGLAAAGETGDGLTFKFSSILHDKDTKLLYDPDKDVEVIEPTKEHVHGFIELPKKRDLNVVAKWIGLKPQYIEIPRGRYGRENSLAYLIHAKSPDKYRYNPKEVLTFGTWDYMEYYMEKFKVWEEYRATAVVKTNKTKVDWLVKQVQLGKLTMSDIMENESYRMVYADNMRLIKDAQQFLNEERAYRTMRAMENKEFQLSVLFVTGLPGAGKTYQAKKICENLERKNNWRTYEASGRNPMDNYSGEEILFMDDLRSSSMSATDWLKTLDHLSSSALSARYANKGRAYRTIIMTAYEDPYTYFSYMKGAGGTDESLAQFIRRLMYTVTVYRLDDGDRVALIETIVQGQSKMYHLGRRELLEDGYKVTVADMGDIKHTNYYGLPIALLSSEDAAVSLSDLITKLNDPAADHSKDERMTVDEYKKIPFTNRTNLSLDDLKG